MLYDKLKRCHYDVTAEKFAFESWALKNDLPIDRVVSDVRYGSMETEHAWLAWLARARVEVS